MFVDYDSTLGINDAKFSCICYYGAGQTPAAEDVDFSPLDAILKRERISITKGIVTGHFGWGKPKFTGVLNRGKCYPNSVRHFHVWRQQDFSKCLIN